MYKRRVPLVVMALCAFINIRSVEATSITFTTGQSVFAGSTLNQGWWSATRANTNSNVNTFTGLAPNVSGHDELRSFFTFDLSTLNLAGQVLVGATLTVVDSAFYSSGDASETLGLFDVSTPAASLNANAGTSAAIFNDLGTGTSFGSFVVASYATATPLTFTLNGAALGQISAGAGGFFSMGGALQTLDNHFSASGFEAIFVGSGDPSVPPVPAVLTLNVEPVAPTVPEPASLVLLATGLTGLYRQRRRRNLAQCR